MLNQAPPFQGGGGGKKVRSSACTICDGVQELVKEKERQFIGEREFVGKERELVGTGRVCWDRESMLGTVLHNVGSRASPVVCKPSAGSAIICAPV